jgi:hypothetical protein
MRFTLDILLTGRDINDSPRNKLLAGCIVFFLLLNRCVPRFAFDNNDQFLLSQIFRSQSVLLQVCSLPVFPLKIVSDLFAGVPTTATAHRSSKKQKTKDFCSSTDYSLLNSTGRDHFWRAEAGTSFVNEKTNSAQLISSWVYCSAIITSQGRAPCF